MLGNIGTLSTERPIRIGMLFIKIMPISPLIMF